MAAQSHDHNVITGTAIVSMHNLMKYLYDYKCVYGVPRTLKQLVRTGIHERDARAMVMKVTM